MISLDESPNLWDANYARKHVYKGTADGLAGKDVSRFFGRIDQKIILLHNLY